MQWIYKAFESLTLQELYDMMKLRQEIFVLEQECLYVDADGVDRNSIHVMVYNKEKLVATARIVKPGAIYTQPAIGRVAVHQDYRKQGIGKQLMEFAIEKTLQLFGNVPIKISAQTYLLAFYTNLGFKQQSEEYLDFGIPHIDMIR